MKRTVRIALDYKVNRINRIVSLESFSSLIPHPSSLYRASHIFMVRVTRSEASC